MNVVYIGNFSGPSGYAVSTRGYLKILVDHPEINVQVLNNQWGAHGEEPDNLDKYLIKNERDVPRDYIVLYHVEPGEGHLGGIKKWLGIDAKKIIKNAKKTFAITAWEPYGVPSGWKDFFGKYIDEIITFCDFQNENISTYIDKPTHTVPLLMTLPPNSPKTISDKFRILSMSQWSYRKGFDILIQAFLSEFFNDTEVELTIKTFGRNGTLQEKEEIIKEIQQYKLNCARHGKLPKCQIKLWYGGIPSSQINTLYNNTDLYVSTTRGEGFGLTIAEALWKGKRVIVPDKGGYLDYIHKNNYFIKSRLETLRCANWSTNYSSDFKLVEPDFEDTRSKLREAYNDFKNNKQDWTNKQEKSAIFTRRHLSENKIKEKLEKIIGVSSSSKPRKQTKKMKIALLTFECPPADYRSLSFPNKKRYCEKHGYKFLGYTKRLCDRPPPWEKLLYLQKHIQDYDWIFWSDSDSFIINGEIKLEDYINEEKDLIIQLDQSDPALQTVTFKGVLGVNSGEMFLKNSDWSRWFLNECYYNHGKYNIPLDHKDWEQGVIKQIIGETGENYPKHVEVYKDVAKGFNVAPMYATPETFLVHFRRGFREGYDYLLDHIF